ncbi:hypothetical protein D3C85_1495390 [compost metagenome]
MRRLVAVAFVKAELAEWRRPEEGFRPCMAVEKGDDLFDRVGLAGVAERPGLRFVVDAVRHRLAVAVGELFGAHALTDVAFGPFFDLPGESLKRHKSSPFDCSGNAAALPQILAQ